MTAVNGLVFPIVGGTGHRSFPARAAARWVGNQTRDLARMLRDEYGMTDGVSGMGFGWDTWWAEAILSAGMRLHAHRPGPWQVDAWQDDANRARWRDLCERAATVIDYNDGRSYHPRYFHARNQGMVDVSNAFVVCQDPATKRGGTYRAHGYVHTAQLPHWLINPSARTVTHPAIPADALF